jgi:hypothetical protein
MKLNTEDVSFGNVNTNASEQFFIQISSIGQAPLQINDFEIIHDTSNVFYLPCLILPIVIEPGDSNNIPVWFRPSKEKFYSAELVIVSNSYQQDSTIIKLSGIGKNPAGIKNNPDDSNYIFYFNPINNNLEIKIEKQNSELFFELYDITSRLVMKKSYQNNDFTIQENFDLTKLNKGIYFVKIYNNRFTKFEKIILY